VRFFLSLLFAFLVFYVLHFSSAVAIFPRLSSCQIPLPVTIKGSLFDFSAITVISSLPDMMSCRGVLQAADEEVFLCVYNQQEGQRHSAQKRNTQQEAPCMKQSTKAATSTRATTPNSSYTSKLQATHIYLHSLCVHMNKFAHFLVKNIEMWGAGVPSS
jgi:hypothetical protein